MNALEWVATVVLIEIAVILLVLVIPIVRYFRGEKPPVEPEEPDEPVGPGVPPGTQLKTLTVAGSPYPSDKWNDKTFTIITAGAQYDGWRFDRQVDVSASGVVFTNCYFAGIQDGLNDSGLVRTIGGGSFTATHCTIRPDHPDNGPDGVRGSNFTLSFCEISGTVDGIHIYGTGDRNDPKAGNVIVTDCWLHDFPWYNDDSHDDGSHNDCVQIVGGHNIRFERNRFSGTAYNAVFMITQNINEVYDLVIVNNSFESNGKTTNDGSQQTISGINLNDGKGSGPITGLRVTDNSFVKGAQVYQLLIDSRTLDQGSPQITGNVWSDGSQPPPAVRRG